MTDRKLYDRLEHIAEYCEKIDGFVKKYGASLEALRENEEYQYLVSFCILQIGELINGMPDDFKQQTADIVEWRSIRGMRNAITHRYGDVDFDIVWDAIENEVPGLKAFCERVLEQRDS